MFWPELYAPATDRFIGHLDLSLREQILDITEAQAEAMIEPDCVLDDFGWETVPAIVALGCFHPTTLPNCWLT